MKDTFHKVFALEHLCKQGKVSSVLRQMLLVALKPLAKASKKAHSFLLYAVCSVFV